MAALCPPPSPAVQPVPLRVRLFGPFEAYVEGNPIPRLRSRKGEWLLALLLLRRGQRVDRDWLMGTLWPDSAPAQASASLRQSLADLRRALGGAAWRMHAPTPRTLALDAVGAEVDVLAFDRELAQGDPAALERALELYRGALLEGCREEWVLPEREVRRQAYLGALQRLAAYDLEAADPAAAVPRLRLLIAADPLREDAHRRLMQALAAGGDYASVSQIYRDLRLLLHRELNAAPGLETTALYERLRAGGRQRAEGASPRRSTPGRLPCASTSFVGRRPEIERVLEGLRSARLVTLTGPGGIGKTRLAARAAEELLSDFPDGVWFVDLSALARQDLVPPAVAAAVGVREEPARPLLELLAQFLASRLCLVVLDNCEQVLEGCAGLAQPLLRDCLNLRVLTTSRQCLGLTGEVIVQVPPLPVPRPFAAGENDAGGCGEGLSALLEYEAVRLFVDRARYGRPEFSLTGENAAAVVEVCCRLDGIPLALELAAARLKTLSVRELAGRLGERFRLLTGGDRGKSERYRTLRGTLDWSYHLLSDAERTLLRRLSVFAGGWTLDAAEDVCGSAVPQRLTLNAQRSPTPTPPHSHTPIPPEDVLALLSGLVEKSLVAYQERKGEARYRMLETVREYARERLRETDEVESLRTRHLDYFRRLAERAGEELDGPDQVRWFDQLETERDNLRQALDRLREQPDGAVGMRLAARLWRFWLVRGHRREGRGWLAEALAGTPPDTALSDRAEVLLGAGVLARNEYDHAAAQALLKESLELHRRLNDEEGRARALANLGIAYRVQGELPRARELLELSLAILRALGRPRYEAIYLADLAHVAHLEGDLGRARTLAEESLAIERELADAWGISASAGALAEFCAAEGDLSRAQALYEEKMAICCELGDGFAVAWCRVGLAALAWRRNDPAAAQEHLEAGLNGYRDFAGRFGLPAALELAAATAAARGDAERGTRLLAAGHALREPLPGAALGGSLIAVQPVVESLRGHLGAAFAAAWQAGHALDSKQAIDLALDSAA
jgi:predicted ATPase/DNA-binding SARP family transcriptional activator